MSVISRSPRRRPGTHSEAAGPLETAATRIGGLAPMRHACLIITDDPE
ncbi:hypothetical protein RHECNPAF_3500064 [Rhizobium etli CNPAF512]|nr:hypothetical protein RHECNPAF_3500064 [Rhizobium etli CNPAF512]